MKLKWPSHKDGDRETFIDAYIKQRAAAAAAVAAAAVTPASARPRTKTPAITYAAPIPSTSAAAATPTKVAAESEAARLPSLRKQEEISARKRGARTETKQQVTGEQQQQEFSLSKVAKKKRNEDALKRREREKARRDSKLPQPSLKSSESEGESSDTMAYLNEMVRHYMGRKLLNVLSSVLRA